MDPRAAGADAGERARHAVRHELARKARLGEAVAVMSGTALLDMPASMIAEPDL